ncbi:MAG: phenylalanine--tRNA ligase subunit beta, partial [Acholeplasmataceae bacterium]
MKIATNMLKRYIDTLPSHDELYELTNQYITEVESMTPILNMDKLVVGYVKERKDHPNSDHLSLCEVDLGDHSQQIVCGASNV